MFLVLSVLTFAQGERNLIPNWNKLLLNPSFAGLGENTSVRTGLQFYSINRQQSFHEFSLTYDYYSPKLDGGIAYIFRQGLLGDVNINTTEAGIAISRNFDMEKGLFIPAINIAVQGAGKQWYVHSIDRMLDKEFTPPAPPGHDFPRFFRVKPRIGFLWDSPFFQTGFSALFPFGKYITNEKGTRNLNEPEFILHLSRLSGGRKKGLVSKTFVTRPQLVLLYANKSLISRAELNMEEVNYTWSVFVQNNYSDNLHGLGGTFGWKIDKLHLNLSIGTGIPGITDAIPFFGEVSMEFIIPPFYFSEENPWKPKKKLF